MSKTTNNVVIGVIGGMGTLATLHWFRLVTQLMGPVPEHQHVHLVIDNNPDMPDRTKSVTGKGESCEPIIIASAIALERFGATHLVMPCNVAHAYADAIRASVSIPFISIIEESAKEAAAITNAGASLGLLMVDGCLQAGLYQQALKAIDRVPRVPSDKGQAEVMNLIYLLKSGENPSVVRHDLKRVTARLIEDGVEALIIGCTELSTALAPEDVAVPCLDTSEILARRVVNLHRAQIGMEPVQNLLGPAAHIPPPTGAC